MRKILSLMMALVMALSLSPMAMAESFTDGTYTGSGKGMMGNIKVSVTVEGGKITAVEVTSHPDPLASAILPWRPFPRLSWMPRAGKLTPWPALPSPPTVLWRL